ncbi:hypothetical protein JKF63_07874 [Porcisia hertigi]|uniref:Uncharacterized protein n=1 Tax=Porcisia hertigi TaxID=2761500 RepID=A0A836LJQ0_9TRYP|nr:hypothetical protein JKF63_07874 [Porcisia hertigi]
MSSSRKRPIAHASKSPRTPAKPPQITPLGQDESVGKCSSVSASASTDAVDLAAPPLLKSRRQVRCVAHTPMDQLGAQTKAGATTSWRARLIHVATQEAHAAAALLRLHPLSEPANLRIAAAAQPNQSLLDTAAPPLLSSTGTGETAKTKMQTTPIRHTLRGAASGSPPSTATPSTADVTTLLTENVKWTLYPGLWEGLLTRLPLVNTANAAATPTPATGGDKDEMIDTHRCQKRGSDPVKHQRDDGTTSSTFASTAVKNSSVHVSAMLRSLNDDWRTFFLHSRRRPSAMWDGHYSTTRSVVGDTVAERCPHRTVSAHGRRLEDLVCSPNMTYAEQRAISQYTTAAIATKTGDTQWGLPSVCVLDLL